MSRIFVTNNLHGYLKEFKYLLNKVKFNFSTDKLILLGNYLNKGPMQLELIDYLIELSNVSDNIHVLCGKTERIYIDALLNYDGKAEQKITRENKNVFYEYLDNTELSIKHMEFLVGLPDKFVDGNYFFTSQDEQLEGKTTIYASAEPEDDFVLENKLLGVAFNKNVGLMELTKRKCYRIKK